MPQPAVNLAPAEICSEAGGYGNRYENGNDAFRRAGLTGFGAQLI
jgi:hypothetical protein